MRLFVSLFFTLSLTLLAVTAVRAEPTEVSIRVLSKDAKFIGSSMGGMRITLRDAMTGEILATGVTSGGTGNTKLLMHKDGGRRAVMVDEKAGGFHTTLDLEEPRLIEVEAYGPLAQLQGRPPRGLQPVGPARQTYHQRQRLGPGTARLCGRYPVPARGPENVQ